MSGLLAINVYPDKVAGGYDFSPLSLEDHSGRVLRGAKAMLLISEGVDAGLLADTLTEIAATLRERGFIWFFEEAPTEEYPPRVIYAEESHEEKGETQ